MFLIVVFALQIKRIKNKVSAAIWGAKKVLNSGRGGAEHFSSMRLAVYCANLCPSKVSHSACKDLEISSISTPLH